MSASTLPDHIVWTGKNTAEVKAWVHTQFCAAPEPTGEDVALFIRRKMSGMTKALWGNVLPEPHDPDVTAALWVAEREEYVGLRDGDCVVVSEAGGFRVEPRVEEVPC